MKIACIGWGSLIWDPRNLKIRQKWFEDGPLLPIEFARQSGDKRITLVIEEKSDPIRTLWTVMSVNDIKEAKESLRKREGCSEEKIAVLKSTDEPRNGEIKKNILKWLKYKQLDAVIWTDLPPKFKGENNLSPNEEELIEYLEKLDYKTYKIAEEYIRKAPKQIDTKFRRAIEKEFGWTPAE